VVVAISHSGNSDELNFIFPALRSLGVGIIAITGDERSIMASFADIVLNTAVPREACPFNLAPTSSATAALAMGDALAVCLMEQKGFTEKDFERVHPGGSLGKRLMEPVHSLMNRENIPCLGMRASLEHAVSALNSGGLGILLLLDDSGRTGGLLTDGDLRRALCAGRYKSDSPVAGVMTVTFSYGRPEQSSAEILDIMESRAITALPILDEEKHPLGIIHLHDLLGKGAIKFFKNG
jgi:arabinose-5-phosphate isomerase